MIPRSNSSGSVMDFRFQRILRPISALTLFFFTWISIEPWNYAVWAQTGSNSNVGAQYIAPASAKQRPESAAEKFEASLRATQKSVEDIDLAVASGKEIALAIETLKGHQQTLESVDPEIRAEFSATGRFLKEKNLPAVIFERHAKAVADYDQNYKRLKGNLDAILSLEADRKRAEGKNDQKTAESKQKELKFKIKAAKSHLAEKVKKPRHQPLDPNNLPYRAAKPTNKKPRLKKEQFTEFLQPQKPVQLAYNGDPTPLLVSHPPDTDLPTPADLAETIEVQFTPEIQAKAAELEHNPVKIYNWVRNNIDFVPTYGSIQGANHCLLTRQCNDMDTASLLIALLRTSGIAARYVYGTIEVPMHQVMNWVGGFTDEQSAINFIGSGGTPVTGLVSGGKIVSARMEHAWVEAYVDYIPSRGAVHKQGDTWVPMDASFKQYAYTSGIDLKTAVPFDAQAFVNQLQSAATIDEPAGYVANIDSAFIQTTVTDLQSRLQSYLNTNLPNATVEDLIGKKTIKLQTFPIMAGTLAYKTVTTGSRFSTLFDALRHKLSFEVGTETLFGPDLTFTANLAELVGHRVTLSYVPATAADQTTVDQSGGLYNTPAYLIQVKSQIKVEGLVKAEGKAVGFGADQNFTMTFSLTDIGIDRLQNTITAGGYYAVGVVPGRLPSGYSTELQKRAQQLGDLVNSGGDRLSDAGLGEQLYLSVMTYFLEADRQADSLSAGLSVAYARGTGEGIFSLSLAVNNLFGAPVLVTVKGTTIDIDRVVSIPASKEGKPVQERNFMAIAGISGAGLEHGVIEQIYNVEAISAVKAIYLANLQGIKTYQVSSTNLAAVLPILKISGDVKTDIQNAVSANKEVIVPERELQVNSWSGVGYIVSDPTTGAAAYLISGGLGGGNNTEEEGIADILNTAAHLFKILERIALVGAIISVALAFFLVVMPYFFAQVFLGTIGVIASLFVFAILMIVMFMILLALYLAVTEIFTVRRPDEKRNYLGYGNTYWASLYIPGRLDSSLAFTRT